MNRKKRKREIIRTILFHGLFVAILGFSFVTALGSDNQNPNTIPAQDELRIPYRTSAPILDGLANDSAWSDIPWVGDFCLLSQPETSALVQTRVKFVHDGTTLYGLVEAEEPNTDKLKLKSQNVRDGSLWKDDCLEFHLDPGGKGFHYFQIIVNWKGTVYDAFAEDDNKGMGTFVMLPEWNADIRTAVRVETTCWRMEIAIPFSSLHLTPDQGSPWGVNVARVRHSGGPEYSSLSALSPEKGFGQPHLYQRAVLDAFDASAFRSDGVILKRQTSEKEDEQPIRLEMLAPHYRDSLFASQRTPRILAKLYCDPGLIRKPISAKLQRKGFAVKVLGFPEAAAEQTLSFEAQDLPEGLYELVIEAPGVKPLKREIRKLPPVEGETWLDDKGNLYVNGEPFIPFGWYMGPLDREPKMNVVLRYGPPDTRYLDQARAGGKKVIATPYPFTSDLFKHIKMQGSLTDEQAAEITKIVEKSRYHPALLAYYLVDEPEGADVSLEWLQAAYKLIRTLDPYHPVLITNYGLRGIQAYYSACDILMPDCYPVFLAKGGTRYPISNLRKWTETARALRPTWMVPQFFDWDGVSPVVDPARPPTFDELRNNVWQSLAAGARGIVGFHYTWDGRGYSMDLRHGPDYLAREVATLQPALYGDVQPDGVVVSVMPVDPTFTAALLKFGSGDLLITVNNSYEPRQVRFDMKSMKNRTFHVVGENRSVTLEDYAFEDTFSPTATHLYTTREDWATALDMQSLRDAILVADRARVKPGNLVGLGNLSRDAFEKIARDKPKGFPVVEVSSQSYLYHSRKREWLVYYLLDGLTEDVTHCTWAPVHTVRLPWVEVTLPKAAPIARVVLSTPLDAHGKAKLRAGRVLVRKQDGTFVTAATFSDNVDHQVDIRFAAQEGTAVRIEPTEFSSGWGKVDFGLLTELEVYGHSQD